MKTYVFESVIKGVIVKETKGGDQNKPRQQKILEEHH